MRGSKLESSIIRFSNFNHGYDYGYGVLVVFNLLLKTLELRGVLSLDCTRRSSNFIDRNRYLANTSGLRHNFPILHIYQSSVV